MNRQIFSLLLLCLTSVVHAQLTVNSEGNAAIGTTPVSATKLKVTSTNTSSTTTAIEGLSNLTSNNSVVYGIIGKAGADTGFHSGFCFGAYGEATGSLDGKNFGVYGVVHPFYSGAGVYGSSSTYYGMHAVTSRYAGFFDGNVHISGNSSLTGVMLSGISGQPSHNITYLSDCDTRGERTSDQLSRISATSFSISSMIPYGNDGSTDSRGEINGLDNTSMTLIDKQVLSKQHYGLDAEQLEEVFPDLVYENEDGSKSINYVEMVPILVQAINELKEEITELRGGDVKPQTRALEGEGNSDDVALLSLGENKPNPFSGTTTIPVSIPESVQTAFIYVYDLTGKKVQQTDITARGKLNVQLDASALTDGMYLYSLIADGKVVQTRRMIVEK